MAKRLGVAQPARGPIRSRCRSAPATSRRSTWPSAYATFANDGVHNDPYFIERIEDRDGKVLYQHQAQARCGCVDEQVARLVNQVLAANVTGGTGTERPDRQRPAGRRQDRHHQRVQRRLVRGLHAAAGHGDLDGRSRRPASAWRTPASAAPPAAATRPPPGAATTRCSSTASPSRTSSRPSDTRRGKSVGKIPNEIGGSRRHPSTRSTAAPAAAAPVAAAAAAAARHRRPRHPLPCRPPRPGFGGGGHREMANDRQPALLALLEVQAHDTRLDQLRHHHEALPAREQRDGAAAALAETEASLAAETVTRDDLARQQKRVDDEVELLKEKRSRLRHQALRRHGHQPRRAAGPPEGDRRPEPPHLPARGQRDRDHGAGRAGRGPPRRARRPPPSSAAPSSPTPSSASPPPRPRCSPRSMPRRRPATDSLEPVPAELLAEYQSLRGGRGGIGVAKLHRRPVRRLPPHPVGDGGRSHAQAARRRGGALRRVRPHPRPLTGARARADLVRGPVRAARRHRVQEPGHRLPHGRARRRSCPSAKGSLGGPRLLHSVVGAVAVLGIVMLATRNRRLLRRRLLGIPIGMMAHLVLDGVFTWTDGVLVAVRRHRVPRAARSPSGSTSACRWCSSWWASPSACGPGAGSASTTRTSAARFLDRRAPRRART